MNEIYIEISKLSNKFRNMCYGLTKDKEVIDDAVQELMLYFMQMNPQTLKTIYEKDSIEGITKYGAIVLKRAITSPRSPFYYKYKKYYTNICSMYHSTNSTLTHRSIKKSLYNIPEEVVIDRRWKKLQDIDNVLDKQTWYDKQIFELYYYEGNTLDSLAEKTKISRNSLFTTIDKVRTIIKKELVDE